jgi:hypothetical protein
MSVSNSVLQIETSASVGGCPWGIGATVSNDLTPRQMMEKAGLDWTVEKVPTYAHYNNQAVPTGMEALVRSSDSAILTQVGKGWNPVQNEDSTSLMSIVLKVVCRWILRVHSKVVRWSMH